MKYKTRFTLSRLLSEANASCCASAKAACVPHRESSAVRKTERRKSSLQERLPRSHTEGRLDRANTRETERQRAASCTSAVCCRLRSISCGNDAYSFTHYLQLFYLLMRRLALTLITCTVVVTLNEQ